MSYRHPRYHQKDTPATFWCLFLALTAPFWLFGALQIASGVACLTYNAEYHGCKR